MTGVGRLARSGGRREDLRLLQGQGRYVADLQRDGAAHLAFVRSPWAHARLKSLDIAAAAAAPGVIAVLTAADLAADGIGNLPTGVPLKRPDGTSVATPKPLLVTDMVRHIAEPYALVVAETAEAAQDAAELVVADFEELPALTTVAEALSAPGFWPDAPDNVACVWRRGDAAATDAAFARADHVVELELQVTRVSAAPMEPRAALAEVADDGRLVLYPSHQSPFALRDSMAKSVFRTERSRVRVVAGDVGGSFGMKSGINREEAAVLWAAQRLGRPVRWVASRSESFLADEQGRDVRIGGALALDSEGSFLGMRVRFDVNIGAYLSGRSISFGNYNGVVGVYRTPHVQAEAYAVLTNIVPVAAYRGAGRPEATYFMERLIDVAARQTGLDRMELRRRNLIPAAAMPFKTPLDFAYDSGDFAANMAEAMKRADVAGFAARRARSEAAGKLRGLGLANPIEAAGGPVGAPRPDRAALRVDPDGSLTVTTGAMSVGQGQETTIPHLLAQRLGIPVERITYRQGDTDMLVDGRGNGGSAAAGVSTAAVKLAWDQLIEKGREVAAARLEAATEDIEFAAGAFRIAGTDRSLTLAAVAAAAADPSALGLDMPAGLGSEAVFQPADLTFPNGCHVCEVEIDPETGLVQVQRYLSVEDIGVVLDPQLVEGQIHGGVAQGLGQVLCEALQYEAGSGQLLSGSFMDYGMPRADDIPPVASHNLEVPTAVNPLGAKGVGEAGTVGAIAAAMNAVCDALAPLGIRHFDMPATPLRVWEAIRAARENENRN